MFEVLQSKFYNLKAALKIYAIPNNLSDMIFASATQTYI